MIDNLYVLVFGHIPSWAGGRQSSGAANVIYELAYYMSKQPATKVTLAATDVYEKVINRDSLTIIGWSKTNLLAYLFFHPFFSFRYFFQLLALYPMCFRVISFWGMFLKGVFLKKSIDEFKPEIVHLHGLDAAIYEKIVPSQIKLAVTHHALVCGDLNIKNQDVYSKLERITCYSKRIDKLYFVSNKLLSDFKDKFSSFVPQVEVILNAYDSIHFSYITPKPHEKITFCTIASMSDRKGQERVVEALVEGCINCKYICVGSIDETIANRIMSIIKGTNVEVDIRGTMTPPEIKEVLSESDYMILPSSSEGFGLVFLESIACGVPVILPGNLPIMNEEGLIRPHVNAIILKDHTVPAILERIPEIKQITFDHKAVSQTVINYTWEIIAGKYVDSFLQLKCNFIEAK